MCNNKLLSALAITVLVVSLGSAGLAQIIVEDESAKWERDLLTAEYPDMSPRITAEYATTIFDIALIPPPDFEAPARIIVEYATAIAQFDPVSPYPTIDDTAFDSCISELCTSPISAIAHDPLEGELTYAWEALDGGAIIGAGADVDFDPPGPTIYPACNPYGVKLTVTSSVTGLSTLQTIGISVKLAGDANGDGYVNTKDQKEVRNHFGQSGDPGWVNADVNCDGYVNTKDQKAVRNQFGQTGCGCP